MNQPLAQVLIQPIRPQHEIAADLARLNAEKSRAEQAAADSYLAEVKEKLHGKFFTYKYVHQYTNQPTVGVVGYKVAKCQFGDAPFEITTTRVFATRKPGKKDKHGERQLGTFTDTNRYETGASLHAIMESHVAEIDQGQFKAAVTDADLLTAMFADRLANADTSPEPLATRDVYTEPDIPFVQLTPPESTHVPGGWFLTSDYKLLLTPQSRQAVLTAIDTKHRAASRIWHEGCERYLAELAAVLESLRKKVS